MEEPFLFRIENLDVAAMLQCAQDIFRLSLLCRQLTPGLEARILFHLTCEAIELNEFNEKRVGSSSGPGPRARAGMGPVGGARGSPRGPVEPAEPGTE